MQPLFYLFLSVIVVVSSLHLYETYRSFPFRFPASGRSIFDSEMSFVSSVRYGVNQRRRHFFFYRDPQIEGVFFREPTLPLLYTAALCTLGGSFAEVSFFICFLNTLSSAILIYWVSHFFTRIPILAGLAYLLNGGLAFFHAMFNHHCPTGDLLHTTCFRTTVPIYSTVGYFLSFSKSSSYTIPLALLAIFIVQIHERHARRYLYEFAGFFAVLIPSPTASVAAFVFGSCFAPGCFHLIPFSVFLLIKLYLCSFHLCPLWSEYKMAGVFFAPLSVCWDSLGFLFFGMVPLLAISNVVVFHRWAVLVATFVLLQVFRCGGASTDNILAITSVCTPFFAVYFVESLVAVYGMARRAVTKGVVVALIGLVVAIAAGGGIVAIVRLHRVTVGLSASDWNAGEWIRQNIKKTKVVLANAEELVPASAVAGRQTLCGAVRAMWEKGVESGKAMEPVREVERTGRTVEVMERVGVEFLLVRKGTRLEEVAVQEAGTALELAFRNDAWTVFRRNKVV
jgi:hypothetical protein